MGSKSRFGGVDHETWVHKNDSTAKAEKTLNDKKSNIVTTKEENKGCFSCENNRDCKRFNATKSRNYFSFGGDSNVVVCDKWKKKENKNTSNVNIKKLMNEFKRGCNNGK
jgi:hypothetical protein